MIILTLVTVVKLSQDCLKIFRKLSPTSVFSHSRRLRSDSQPNGHTVWSVHQTHSNYEVAKHSLPAVQPAQSNLQVLQPAQQTKHFPGRRCAVAASQSETALAVGRYSTVQLPEMNHSQRPAPAAATCDVRKMWMLVDLSSLVLASPDQTQSNQSL